jgi:sensor histidine kinase YesM
MVNFSKKEIRIHLICWLIYIFVEVVLAGFIAEKFQSFFFYALFYVINIGIFYFHSLWVMPLLYKKSKNRLLYFLLGLLFAYAIYLAGATMVNLLLEYFRLKPSPLNFSLKYISITLFRATFFTMYGTGYFYLNRYLERKDSEMKRVLEIEGLKYQLVVAEKDFLRAQINPHLLFNTLAFIRNASKNNLPNASLAIAGLTGLMEYALEDSKSDFVLLTREIEQMENLIRLNRLRFEHLLHLNYSRDIRNEGAVILPIILLTLVENIFKHGILNNPDHPANIEIFSDETQISFSTSNLAQTNGKTTGRKNGMNNISARLKHAYTGRHHFVYGMTGSKFETQLKIYFV